jgi:anti-anti-sigma regulatory factor
MFTVSAVVAHPAVSWVAVTGKLVGDGAATRLALVLRQQRTTGCQFVRLDLSELSMLDRAGFDVLVEAHHQFVAAGGALVVTGVGPGSRGCSNSPDSTGRCSQSPARATYPRPAPTPPRSTVPSAW